MAMVGRRELSPAEKISVVMNGMKSKEHLGRLCLRYEISRKVYEEWRGTVANAGRKALAQAARSEKARRGVGKALTPEQKVAIVFEGRKRAEHVAELAKRRGITPKQYYEWRDIVVEAGKKAFAPREKLAIPKQAVAVGIVLLALIIGAAGWSYSRMRRGPARRGRGSRVRRIDTKTMRTFTFSEEEWQEEEGENHTWRHPSTGEYTIVDIMTCPQCGAKIPSPLLTKAIVEQGEAAIAKVKARHKCPKCQARVFPKQ